tara:strand:+ start:1197 stop:1724 length:528 start_codon:yes stop_codon:yes gene_type:complete
MNRSYSKIRHIQESNMLLERRKLNLILEVDQALMDKMVAETQSLAQGAVGVTFGDMKVLSASVVSYPPESWVSNGAIVLMLTTNYGGQAKQIPIGLLSDTTGEVKIVESSRVLKPIDAISVKSAMDKYLQGAGQVFPEMLKRAITQTPNPFKTLLTVLQGIAAKYKTSGLAAPTK